MKKGKKKAHARVHAASNEPAALTLKALDLAILEYLAGERVTRVQADITAAVDHTNEKTIRERLRLMEEGGLVHRPQGKRSGYAITDAGREAVAARPAKCPQNARKMPAKTPHNARQRFSSWGSIGSHE